MAACVAVAAGACSATEREPTTTLPATTTTADSSTTTIETTTTTVAAGDSGGLVVTFDGEACGYSGPDRANLADEISLTFVNESDDVVFGTLKLIPPDRIEELEPLVGTDFEFCNETELDPSIIVQPSPRSEDTTSAFPAAPGTYVVDCTLWEDNVSVHTWWPVALEVTP